MKRLSYILILIILTGTAKGQQFPFLEGYNLNPFCLSPSYAGIHNQKTLFLDYRSDWSGIQSGPSTIQMSYNDKYSDKVGFGGRFIYDKTDIFRQSLILGTYTYEVVVAEGHLLNLGLSAGFFRNSIDMSKYYNNPDFVDDQVLMYGREKSKLKFASDFSALYRFRNVEAGILFSNIMIGTTKYRDSDFKYKPFRNYLIHGSYNLAIDERWELNPTVIFRDGKNVPAQFEICPSVIWDKKIWGNALFRTGGIFGLGFGGEVYKGLLLNYSYNLSSGIALNTFGSHQISLGVRLNEFLNY